MNYELRIKRINFLFSPPWKGGVSGGFWAALFSLIIFTPLAVYSAGLSVSPSRLDIHSYVDSENSTSITVSNPTDEVSLIEVYPDDFRSIISVSPQSLTLEAGESQKVIVTIVPQQAGVLSTYLSVVSRPLGDRSFKAGSGIKIPLEIQAVHTSRSWPWWLYAVTILDIALLAVFAVYFLRRKKKFKLPG